MFRLPILCLCAFALAGCIPEKHAHCVDEGSATRYAPMMGRTLVEAKEVGRVSSEEASRLFMATVDVTMKYKQSTDWSGLCHEIDAVLAPALPLS